MLNEHLSIGAGGESAALDFYIQSGYKVVDKNFYNTKGLRLGEIDLIVEKGNQLVFVEVKTRSSKFSAFGAGIESVTRQKQQKIKKAVYMFLKFQAKYQRYQYRVDIVEVLYNRFDNNFKIVNTIVNAVEE